MSHHVIVPPPLQPGDRIAIVSPAGAVNPAFIDDAVILLHDRGFRPCVSAHARGSHGSFSGSLHERLADFTEAISDCSVRAILCARGGFGAVQLLEHLDRLDLRADPKWIMGFSDISAIHALMHSRNIASLHSPMVRHLSKTRCADLCSETIMSVLRGDFPEYSFDTHPYNRCGEAEAQIVGGNLAVLDGLASTPFDVFRPGTILFIEDISEPVYKVERMLWKLRLSGVLQNLAGLIVGQFTNYVPKTPDDTVENLVRDMTRDYSYPVAFNAPIGHVDYNLPIIESVTGHLDVAPEQVKLSFRKV